MFNPYDPFLANSLQAQVNTLAAAQAAQQAADPRLQNLVSVGGLAGQAAQAQGVRPTVTASQAFGFSAAAGIPTGLPNGPGGLAASNLALQALQQQASQAYGIPGA